LRQAYATGRINQVAISTFGFNSRRPHTRQEARGKPLFFFLTGDGDFFSKRYSRRQNKPSRSRKKEGMSPRFCFSLIELEVCDEGALHRGGCRDTDSPKHLSGQVCDSIPWKDEGVLHAQKRTACASHSWLRNSFEEQTTTRETSSVCGGRCETPSPVGIRIRCFVNWSVLYELRA